MQNSNLLVQILTVLLVITVLAEIRGLKLVIGWFSPMFAGLDWSISITKSTALGVSLSMFGGGFVVAYNIFILFE